MPHLKSSDHSSSTIMVSKDVDILIVPVAAMDGITVGYTFMNGVQSAMTNVPDNPWANFKPPNSFITGRFCFDEARRDYLMAVNGLSPYLTGLISLRWRDKHTRDNAFFAIPKASYGAHNLPSRVLNLQCNIDYQQPRPYDNPPPRPSQPAPKSPEPTPPQHPIYPDHLPNASLELAINELHTLLPDGLDALESIGTVLQPSDTDILPDLFPDFPSQALADMDQLLSDTSTMMPTPEDSYGSDTVTSPFSVVSPASPCSRASPEPVAMTSNMTHSKSWLLSASPPDGVGVPRVPGSSDTSSGAFNMNALSESLASIELTMKGDFFSHRVRKDILHPQTGELMSRCTGLSNHKMASELTPALRAFKQAAAQTYFASQLSARMDHKLLLPNVRRRVATLAPRPTVASGDELSEEEKAKKAKLEAKKIKNRMSAAKSNQKRRQQLEAQRNELAFLKERVELLKNKKHEIIVENEQLRKRVRAS